MQCSSPDVVTIRLWRKIPENAKAAFFSALSVGLLTHMFMLTNKFVNHDDLLQLFDRMYMQSSGRWFLFFPAGISSAFSMPWVNGLLGILYLSIASALIVTCLKIIRPLYCALVAGLVVTFPSVACIFSFMNCADAYFFGLMLVCCSVYMQTRSKYGMLCAVPLLALGTGIYQAYVTFYCGLCVMMLIVELLRGEIGLSIVMRKAVLFAVTFALGMLLYVVVVKLTTMNEPLTTYQHMDKIGSFRLREIPKQMMSAYESAKGVFLENSLVFFSANFKYLYRAEGALILLLVISISLWNKIPLCRLPAVIALLVALPLACNIVFLTGPELVHALMIHGLVLLPVFAVALLDVVVQCKTPMRYQRIFVQCVSWMLSVSIALCIFDHFIVSNKAYFKLHLTYERTMSYSTRLAGRIEAADGYTAQKRVLLVGKPDVQETTEELIHLDQLAGIVSAFSLLRADSYPLFMTQYVGFENPITRATAEQLNEPGIAASLLQMPLYPAEGSIVCVDDTVLVKFSEERDRPNLGDR